MNKKFSTFLAGLLLAGGITANAASPVGTLAGTPAQTHVLGEGKYFKIHRTQFRAYNGSSWTNDATYYLTLTNALTGSIPASTLVFSNDPSLLDKSAYWTIKDVTVAGEAMLGSADKVVQLVNAEGYTLTLDATTHKMATAATTAANKIDRFYLDANSSNQPILKYQVNGDIYVVGNNTTNASGSYELEGIKNTGATYGTFNDIVVEAIVDEAYTAAELNAILRNGFQLSLFSKGEAYTNLQGNVFTGTLTAEAVPSTSGIKYYLKRNDGKYIVLTENVWSENTANLDGKQASAYRGYKFDAVSQHTFDNIAAADKVNAQFTIYKSYSYNDEDSLIVTLPKATVGEIGATGKDVKVFVSNVDSKNYVTVIESEKANDRLAAVNNNGYTNTQVGALAPYIKFGATNDVVIEDFAGKVWNIILKTNDYILSPKAISSSSIDGYVDMFVPAEQVELNYPEGHWLAYNNGTQSGFINRESGHVVDLWSYYGSGIRKIGTDLYRCYYNGGNSYWDIYIKEAKDAELGKTEKGYAKYDEAVEALNGKYLTLTEAVSGNPVYVSKNANNEVVLSTDKSNAIEFRIKEAMHDYTEHDGLAGIDTLQHYTTYLTLDKNGDLTIDVDTVQFYQYMLYEHFSEKYLTYNSVTKKFELSTWSRTNNAHEDFSGAPTYVIKVKGDGTYNLIRAYNPIYPVCTYPNTTLHQAGDLFVSGDRRGYEPEFDNDFETNLGNADKVYGAFQTATLADMDKIYNYNDNDRFALEAVATPEYQTVTDAQANVKISRQGNANILMYEHNVNGTNFLAMDHLADVEDMKAAMMADTAYVRYDTFKPQYLLAVGAEVHAEEFCSRPDLHAALHKDTVYGRFLVNLKDSITPKTVNHYTWDKNSFYKLGFVEGIHTEDYLYLTKDGKKTGEKIFLGNNDDKVCTFAFRYVDEAREGVKMETLYDTNTRGWIKWHNGVPVVIDNYDEADVFVVNPTEEAPTANDEIAVSEVSVVAVDGAVIVKGAAGKTVAISNILGKTIANTVIASDNETISVPAGIAVVAVDGEEAVKVVVK